MVSRKVFVSALSTFVPLFGIFVAIKLGPFEGQPEFIAPPDAIPIWRNPDLSILNKILEYLFPLIVPIGSMIHCSPHGNIDSKCMSKARDAMKRDSDRQWKSFLDGQTHEEKVVKIQRKDDSNEHIEVFILNPTNKTTGGGMNNDAPPLIIWIHGGGFTIGNAQDSYLTFLLKGIQQHDAYNELSTSALRNAVWASIEYRLAPEHKYPAAPDDCITAVEYLLKKYRHTTTTTAGDDVTSGGDNQKQLGLGGVHIFGASAGATLAVMTAQEAIKKGLRVDSIYADAPVFPIQTHPSDSPYGSLYDSPFYRRNWYTRIPPQQWIEWFTSAYTGCSHGKWLNEGESDESKPCLDDAHFFIGGSLSPNEWKSKKKATLPELIVVTYKGDPFHDTAFPLMDMYKNVAGTDKVHHIDIAASHTSFFINKKGSNMIYDILGKTVNDKSATTITAS